MENENSELVEQTTPPDFTNLEQTITELVEVIQTEQEIKAEEKAEEVLQNEKTETDLQDMQTVVQTSTESQEAILEGLSSLSGQMSGLANQMDTINTTMTILVEKTEEQNNLIVEGSFTITIAIAVVVAMKVLIDQISKW
jgi:hypothetical protein